MLSSLLSLPGAALPAANYTEDDYYYTGNTVDSGEVAAVLLVVFALYALLLVLLLVASGFAWAGLFAKAGQPKWAAFIPGYNSWIIVKIAGRPASSFWLQFIPYAGIYWTVISVNDLAKSFGKDAAYTVGLLFVPLVFASILSYGQARYLGPAYISPEQKAQQQYYAQQQYAAAYAQQGAQPGAAYTNQPYGQTYAQPQYGAPQQYPGQQSQSPQAPQPYGAPQQPQNPYGSGPTQQP